MDFNGSAFLPAALKVSMCHMCFHVCLAWPENDSSLWLFATIRRLKKKKNSSPKVEILPDANPSINADVIVMFSIEPTEGKNFTKWTPMVVHVSIQ